MGNKMNLILYYSFSNTVGSSRFTHMNSGINLTKFTRSNKRNLLTKQNSK